MHSEKVVAAATKTMAAGPAFSWTVRHQPWWCSACSGSELPAMKPATQAIACSASTSELRKSTWPTEPSVAGALSPGIR